MKIRASARPGFTIVETMITIGITTIVGGMIFLVLSSGLNLYAKNTAVNAAHQQARTGVDQLLQNIHGAVSIPQLVNASLTPIPPPGTGPAAGINFQRFEAGPFPVTASATASATSLVVASGSFAPSSTTRLNIAAHKIELDVISSTDLGGGKRRYNFAGPIGVDVNVDGNGETGFIIPAFMTFRASYAVIGSELRYFPTNNLNNYKVIARNISSATPFLIPTLSSGSLQNKYVAAINISTVEPQFSNRGYAAVNMFISSLIPFRSRMTTYQ